VLKRCRGRGSTYSLALVSGPALTNYFADPSQLLCQRLDEKGMMGCNAKLEALVSLLHVQCDI
jgi:hypothetical protein